MIGKLLIGGAAAIAAIVLSGGSAFAFHCFNASRSEDGDAHAANGRMVSVEEFLSDPEIVGLCPAGVDHVIEGLQDEGFDTDMLFNFNTLMAGGLEKTGDKNGNLDNDKGIDHLDQEFMDAADALIGEGFGLCNRD